MIAREVSPINFTGRACKARKQKARTSFCDCCEDSNCRPVAIIDPGVDTA